MTDTSIKVDGFKELAPQEKPAGAHLIKGPDELIVSNKAMKQPRNRAERRTFMKSIRKQFKQLQKGKHKGEILPNG